MFDESGKSETTMEAAFSRAGFSKGEMEFHAACSKAMRAGVTFDAALAVLKRAYQQELRSGGQEYDAGHCHDAFAPVPQPELPGSGQSTDAKSGQAVHATARQPVREQAGQSQGAKTGQSLAARPARVPTAGERMRRVEARIKTLLTVMDTYTIRGKVIGNLTMAQVNTMRHESAKDAALLDMIRKHTANAKPNQHVRDVIKVSELQRFIQRAVEMADAA